MNDATLARLWAPRCTGPHAQVSLFGTGRALVRPALVDAVRAMSDVFAKYSYATRRFDTGGYVCRKKVGGNGWSTHAYGVTVDVNWTTNPYGSRLRTDMPRAMVNEILALRTNSGAQVWEWGGNWSGNKDAMHFQIACSPRDLATGIAQRPSGYRPPPPSTPSAPIPTPPITIPEGDDDMAIIVKVVDANPTDKFKAGESYRLTATTIQYLADTDHVVVHQEMAPVTGDHPDVVAVNAPKMRSFLQTRKLLDWAEPI